MTTGPQQFGKLNMMAMLRKWIDSTSGIFTSANAPIDGTLAGLARKGALLINDSNLSIQSGDIESPIWTPVSQNYTFDYNFTRDGGAIGTILLSGTVPSGTLVVGGILDITETFTSTGDSAIMGISLESATDIYDSDPIDSPLNPWDMGLKPIVPQMYDIGLAEVDPPVSSLTMRAFKLTADRQVQFVITPSEAVLSGAFNLHLLTMGT